MSATTSTSSAFDFGVPQMLFPVPILGGDATFNNHRYGATGDGRRFLINSLMSDGSSPAPITVVLNWQEELKRRTSAH